MEPSVIVRVVGRVGRLTLNRPKALNALDLDMVRRMRDALLAWCDDAGVASVVVDGAGDKAFCAGGDIRALYEAGKVGDISVGETFWREEYQLNDLIASYPKPYVALIDGIVMGGGVGVSVHGRYRVAGDRTLFAMPETGIGFHPDVGASAFLPRLPGGLGLWLGLTGARIKAGDVMAAGLATHLVPSARHEAALSALETDASGDVAAVLSRFAVDPPAGVLDAHREEIDACFAGAASVGDVLSALAATPSDWARSQADTLATKSPLSLVLTHASLKPASGPPSLRAALANELALSVRCLSDGDFVEGVRALLIDRDNAPRWAHADVAGVSAEIVARFFSPDHRPPLFFLDEERAP